MSAVTFTLPILPGKSEAWRRFCQEIEGARRPAYEASRRRLGIARETMRLVERSQGRAVLLTIEAADLGAALDGIASSQEPFDQWYRRQLLMLHGFRFSPISTSISSRPVIEYSTGG